MEKNSKEDTKYSVLGEIILKITDKINNKTQNNNAIKRYLRTTSRKNIFKDILTLVCFIGFWGQLYYMVENIEYLVVPQVTDTRLGITVSGNCSFIHEIYQDLKRAKTGGSYVFDYLDSSQQFSGDKNYSVRNYVTPAENIKYPTNTTTLTPTTTTIMPCPTCPTIPECVCTCPTCSVCRDTYSFTDKEIDWMLNDCKIKVGSAGYQGGSADTCFKVMEYFKIPGRPKFKLSSSTFYNPNIKQIEKDCTVCFSDGDCDGAFYLNNSIWMIRGEGVMKWIHKK